MAVNQWTPIKEDNSAAVSLFDIASRSFTEVGNIVDKVWDRFNKQRQFDQEMAHKQAVLDEDIRYHILENEFKLKNLREQARQHDTSLEEQSRQFAANLGLDTQKANTSNLLTLAQLQENSRHYRATEDIGAQNALTSRIQAGLMALYHAGSNAVKDAAAQVRAATAGSSKSSKDPVLVNEALRKQIELLNTRIEGLKGENTRKKVREEDVQRALTDLGNTFPQLGEVYKLKGDLKNLRSSTGSKSSFAKFDSNPLMIKNLLEGYEKAENKQEYLDQLATYSDFSDEDMKALKQYIPVLHAHNTALSAVQKAMKENPKIIENVNKLIKGSALGTLYGVGDDSENEFRYNLALEEKKVSAKQAELDFRHKEAELVRQFRAEQDEKKRAELGKQFKEKMELAYKKAGFHPEQAKALSGVFLAEKYYDLMKEKYDKNPEGKQEKALLEAAKKGVTQAKQEAEKLLPYQAYKTLLKQDNPKKSSNSNNDEIPSELLDNLLNGADAATLLQKGLTFNQAATATKIRQAQENIKLITLRAQGQALRNASLELNNRLKAIKVDNEENKRKATRFFSDLATLVMSKDSPLNKSLTDLRDRIKAGEDTSVAETAVSNTLLQLAIENEIPVPEHMLKNNGNVFKITARYANPKGLSESVTALLGSLLGLSPNDIAVPEFFQNMKNTYDKEVEKSEGLDKEIEDKAKLWYNQDENVKPTGGLHFPQSWFPFKSPQLGDAIIEIGARSYQLRYRQKYKKEPSESSIRTFKNIIAAGLADFVPKGPNSDVFYFKGHEWDPQRFLEHLAKNRRYLAKTEFGQGIIQDMRDAFERIHSSIGDNVFTSNNPDKNEADITQMVNATNAKVLIEMERDNLKNLR